MKDIKINKSKLKAVIFDCNGVIIDDYPLQKEAWNQISLEIRRSPVTDVEMLNNIRGIPTQNTVKRMLSEVNKSLDEKTIIAYALQKDNIVEGLFKSSPLCKLNEGLELFLNTLKTKGIPITIATSSTKKIFTFLFAKLNLGRWFDFNKILFNDGTYPGKPAPDPYLLAANKLGFTPEECLVFEDAKSGIQSAYAAGVKNIVAIGTDDKHDELAKIPGVVKTISNFIEISIDDFFI